MMIQKFYFMSVSLMQNIPSISTNYYEAVSVNSVVTCLLLKLIASGRETSIDKIKILIDRMDKYLIKPRGNMVAPSPLSTAKDVIIPVTVPTKIEIKLYIMLCVRITFINCLGVILIALKIAYSLRCIWIVDCTVVTRFSIPINITAPITPTNNAYL